MRMRGIAAAVAGIVGAATAHALDTAGLLPGVHETADVRGAMGPLLTAGWLGAAGALATVAARTRPALVGGGSALVLSAVPELVGRHDPGAIAEPGAIAGALLQWLVLLAVVGVLVLVDRGVGVVSQASRIVIASGGVAAASTARVTRVVDPKGRPRAPPAVLLSAHRLLERKDMTAHQSWRVVAPAFTLPLVVLLGACGGSSSGGGGDGDNEGSAADKACSSDITKTASTALPSDVPAPDGASDPYQYFPQGATKVWNFAIDGSPADLPSLRDSYDNALKAKGYEIEDTDQEENAEAESEFKGAHTGTTNFRPLCEGKVVFRLKLTS